MEYFEPNFLGAEFVGVGYSAAISYNTQFRMLIPKLKTVTDANNDDNVNLKIGCL